MTDYLKVIVRINTENLTTHDHQSMIRFSVFGPRAVTLCAIYLVTSGSIAFAIARPIGEKAQKEPDHVQVTPGNLQCVWPEHCSSQAGGF